MEETNIGKSSRVLYLYAKLLRGQIIRKDRLAEQFGVNERSIQRDLDIIRSFLDMAEVEEDRKAQLIYDYREKGYRLKQEGRINLSNEEVLAVSKILLASRAFTKREMLGILDSLIENCVPKEERRLVDRLLENEKFHYAELQHHKIFLDKLIPLGKAIRESRVIRIQYGKLKEKDAVERRLEPLAILFSEYYFYLVAFIEEPDGKGNFESKENRFPAIYRIDRIENLEVLAERFKIPYADRFEEGEFRKRIQFMYGGELRKIRFRYRGVSVEAVLDRLPTARILKEEDGAYVIEAEVYGKGVDMWVRGQGEDITDYTEI
ncbi:MAG: WYL domain-containing protein [Lachnospiraceae bacterium]|nr:WYL domain-containing protein [Lachnospiraceae bacterium]